MNICVLRSGSRGNCTIVWSKDGALLLDCGNFPMRPFCDELSGIGLAPEDIKGIVISHGHGDHINQQTLRISSRFNIPIHIHPKTYEIVESRFGKGHPQELVKHHRKKSFVANNMKITPFDTKHKGGYVGKPFGFILEGRGRKKYKIGYLTDTSKVTKDMIDCLLDSDVLLIESNYDLSMVRENAPFDRNWLEHLKNEDAADAAVYIKKASKRKNALKHIFAMHISGRHNDPDWIKKVFKKKFNEAKIKDIEVILTQQKKKSAVKTI